MLRRASILLCVFVIPAAVPLQYTVGDEIGFIEKFALAKDRDAVLKELVPGTEDYYYFHCLHYQNTEQFDKVEAMLDRWITRHDYPFRATQSISHRAREIVNRQMLLTYSSNPQRTLSYLERYLKLNFNHQRESMQGPSLPSVLNPVLVSRKTLVQRALARHTGINGFEQSALNWLLDENLSRNDLYAALKAIRIPDHPRLVEMLNQFISEDTHEFGQLAVHRLLTKQQLLHLANLKPRLMNNSNFVYTYMARIRPNPDVHFESNAEAQKAHLTELWDFVNRLQPAYNTLKAHVLYHRLVFDRSIGVYDKERFLAYIQLPREAVYIEPKYHRQRAFQNYKVNFNQDFSQYSLYPRIGNDEPLIRSYLHHFFIDAADYREFEKYIHYTYLKRQFAETKIVNGLGENEKWADYLSATDFQQLRNRVDLDFVPTSKHRFGVDDPVSVELHVKNVQKLIVKVFELNTQNFYRDKLAEIDTNIELDGLLPNREYTYEYTESPFLRVKRKFDFPDLSKPGVYVIDFIGNRKSSRVLIRKGRLRYIEEITPAGHQLTVVDQDNRPVPGAIVWMPGAQYTADKDGNVMIPFSNQPSRVPLVLSHEGFSSFDYFNHTAESYALDVGFHVDRESLIRGNEATLVVRPQLLVNGIPASLSVLQKIQLTISSTDLDGSASTKTVKDFKLFEDRESEYKFRVPPRLRSLSFSLQATVRNLSRNQDQTLSASDTVQVNQIDTDVKVEDLHLSRISGQYCLDLLGKNGEQRAGRPVQLTLKHRDFKDPVQVALQTSMKGRINLGPLAGIQTLTVAGPEGTSRSWNLLHRHNTYYSAIHALEGDSISVPLAGADRELSHHDVALLEMRGGNFIRNFLGQVKLANGILTIQGLKRGDYRLVLKNIKTIDIRVVKGRRQGDVATGEHRELELNNNQPLQITAIDRNREKTLIRVSGANKFTRVHVLATRYVPRFHVFDQLAKHAADPAMTLLPQAQSLYVVGRKIGDEYQYILDRKYAEKYPGVMLKRPGLLLQPWAVRTTQTSRQDPNQGTRFDAKDRSSGSESSRPGKKPTGIAAKSDPANLDFLGQGSVVLTNLELNGKGQLEIDNVLFRGLQHLQVCVIGPDNAAFDEISFDESALEPDDLRLVFGLDPEKRFARKKEISFVDQGMTFEVIDVTTGEFEIYDNLPAVYRLFTSLTRNPNLAEFQFILDWNERKREEKLDLYSKYACHELNFFIYKKDPGFFRSVVRPYLANKKDKTFLDRWLLGEDLQDYLTPWHFQRLNTVERVLLAQAIDAEYQFTARNIREQYFLRPTPQSQFDRLFGFALQGNALETSTRGLTESLSRIRDEVAKSSELQNRFAQNGQGAANYANNRPSSGAGGGMAGGVMRGRGGRAQSKTEADKAPGNYKEAPAENWSGLEIEEAEKLQSAEKKLSESRRSTFGRNADAYFKKYDGKRKQLAQLFRQVDKTQEWAENNYYKLTIDRQIADLVKVNRFWKDYAEHRSDGPFRSVNIAEASGSFTEMMFALAVLDLDWKPGKHDTEEKDNRLVLTAGSPLLIYHDQIRPAKDGRKETSVLVSQNFFKVGDRYRYEGPDRLDKFVTDEFIKRTAYGCQVVVTNPTSAKQKIDLLLQIPRGSMPLKSTRETRSVHLEIEPYQTSAIEYFFYFPESGDYSHYPVNVARNEEVIAFAESTKFHVVDQPSKVDKTSWAYISQYGSGADVLEYLEKNNLLQTDLKKIAWRMQDKDYFGKVISLLDRNHVFHSVLWSYAVKHNVAPVIRQFLNYQDALVNQTGPYIESELLVNDRVARGTYEHLEYEPLVNARAHQLGQKRQILNDRFYQQYHRLLWILGCKRGLDDVDHLALTYYLLLQDRIGDARTHFAQVSRNNVPSVLQYEYMAAYMDMFNDKPTRARDIAKRYADYPVKRWRNVFAEILNQLDEIEGRSSKIVDADNRENVQDNLASKAPSFDFKVDAKQVKLSYRNLKRIQVNYYVMDVELLFSRNPFVQQYSGELTYIRPRKSEWIELPADKDTYQWSLPQELHRSNVLVEIGGGNLVKSQAYYAHAMNVQLVESYGQLRVTDVASGNSVPKTYCKVYARMKDGQTRFYKDGYTDLRGRFDYTSLSTNDLDNVQKFSILVMSDELGATVREATPPKR